MAAKRKDAAKAEARSAGISVDDVVPGTFEVYNDDNLVVSEQIKNPVVALDKTALMNLLTRRYGRDVAQSIMDDCSKTNACARSFVFSVK